MDSDVADALKRYRSRLTTEGATARALGWTKGTQPVRFGAAWECMRDERIESIVDVGCGFGDLLSFLRERGWAGNYWGIDLIPEFIDIARQRHREDRLGHFECSNLIDATVPDADWVVALGIFNHGLQTGNLAFVRQALKRMWGWAGVAVTADFLSASVSDDRRRADLEYYDVGAVVEAGRDLSPRLLLRHDYMPFEFMLTAWRDSAFTEARPVFARYAPLIAGGGPEAIS
jgi:SAM-dependent methyltransferase